MTDLEIMTAERDYFKALAERLALENAKRAIAEPVAGSWPATPRNRLTAFRVIESPLVPDGVIYIGLNRLADLVDALNTIQSHRPRTV